jgi:hypothetical protein
LEGQVTAPVGGGIFGPHLCAGAVPGHHRSPQRLPGGGELLSRGGGACGLQDLGGLVPGGADGVDQGGQDGQPFPGPLVHPGLAVGAFLLA